METPARKVSRLLGALETLSDQEFTLLNSGAYAEALVMQDRRRPLVEEIARIMALPGVAESLDSDIQIRAEELISKQAAQLTRLETEKVAAKSELQAISTALARTHSLGSAYKTKGLPGAAQTYTGSA